MKLLLASESPRRAELLRKAGFDFERVEPGVECPEDHGDELGPRELAEALASQKALGASLDGRSGIVLASDTVVALGPQVLGKPKDRAEAKGFLALLSGQDHEVFTAVALQPCHGGLIDGQELIVSSSRAVVRFPPLSEVEVESLLDAEDYADKAGAYGIQASAGQHAILISGELDTVIGLPMQLVRSMLEVMDRRDSGGTPRAF